jgi:hypothetical protein
MSWLKIFFKNVLGLTDGLNGQEPALPPRFVPGGPIRFPEAGRHLTARESRTHQRLAFKGAAFPADYVACTVTARPQAGKSPMGRGRAPGFGIGSLHRNAKRRSSGI